MFDADMKPWVLEVNCLPSLSSSSVFDKQVKTQLIADTFTLIGFRGYDKAVFRNGKKVEDANEEVLLAPEPEDPKFNKSLKMGTLEAMGGCTPQQPADSEDIRDKIERNFRKTN